MATYVVHQVQKLTPTDRTFNDLNPAIAEILEHEALTTTYPTGAMLFAEGQAARGVFIVRRARVKLSICGREGRTLILRMVEPGVMLGVAPGVSACNYEA